MWDFGFRIQDATFRIQDSRFRIQIGDSLRVEEVAA
jgi:hypothetical protein